MESNLTPQESLNIIRQMIAASRQNVREHAPLYILWGVLVPVAASLFYILTNYTSYTKPWIVWPVVMGGGGLISPFLVPERKEGIVPTAIDYLLQSIYTGGLIWIAIALIIGVKAGWSLSYSVFIIFYGYTSLIAGAALKFKPLKIGGLLTFPLGIAACFTNGLPLLVLLVSASLAAYLIPGLLLLKNKE